MGAVWPRRTGLKRFLSLSTLSQGVLELYSQVYSPVYSRVYLR
jgi:hypothetical protein